MSTDGFALNANRGTVNSMDSENQSLQYPETLLRTLDMTVVEALTEGLNPEQASAVRALQGPVVVIAGPGSGKTRVLTHRVAALVRSGLAWPGEILAVTFTNKAAGEMRERLGVLLGEDTVRPMWVCTFHSLCAKILRIEAQAAGLPRAYSILDSGDVRSILREIHRDLLLPDEAADVRMSASTISRVKNGAAVRPDERTSKVMQAYAARLARLGALDFDDLLLRTRELLENDAVIRAKYQKRFRYVLVDEYQDTNPVQYHIVGMLSAGHRNICVVGDADQSIYGFRSATPAALQTFNDDWPDAVVVILEENYRSSGAILSVCQAVIAPNPAKFRSALRTSNAEGDPVQLVICDDDREEARFVATNAARARRSGSTAVLMRTNAQTRSLEDALLQEGVPYTVIGALRFYERSEIKDAVAYLRLLLNPTDAMALARVVANPRRGLGPKALGSVEEAAAGGDLVLAIERGLVDGTIMRARNGWEELLGALDAVRVAAETGGPQAAVKAVLDSGVREHVRVHGGENSAERLENLDELLNAAAEFAARNPTGGVGDDGEIIDPRRLTELFLEQIALTASADDTETDSREGAVQLLTAHASKGKEFDTVFVIGVEENLFPHGRRGEVADEKEERRLLFVACSRARSHLTLTRAKRRFVHGNIIENPASRFLDDLPAEVETTDLSRVWPGSVNASRRAPRAGSRSEHWGRPGGNKQGTGSPPGALVDLVRPVVAAGPRLTADAAVVGQRVRHATFGEGTISAFSGDVGDEIVAIRFADGAPRQFKLALAPIEAL